jgi:endo-1,4-beta-xylanase
VLATINDATKDVTDGVTIFIEPKNRRSNTLTNSTIVQSILRKDALNDTGTDYTVMFSVPFTGKLESSIAFDLRIVDGSSLYSWNDYGNTQDTGTQNYGQVTLKQLPTVIYAKRGTIVVDRTIDPIWNTVDPIPIEAESMGYVEKGSQFRVLWDDNYLYVLTEVKDSVLNDKNMNTWEQDSIEVFIDQNNGKTTTYEADDAQYRVNYKNQQSFNGGDPERFKSATRLVVGGYIVEVAVPFTHIKPEAGTLIGFDVQINEADASGSRVGIRNWYNTTNLGYTDTSGLGILMLIE